MSLVQTVPVIEAQDGYESYYAEKLWHWIPEIYRHLDAQEPAGNALRAIVEIVAAEAATVRRDIDRVWDDQSIELCDAWAISYLGALVGAVPVSPFNARGNRLAVAKAVYYQRRNGTPALLQELIRDMAEVEGVVVEAFRRLVRFPHRLDIGALTYGDVTRTPAGGLIDLHDPRVKGLHDTGFDEAAHFPDIRRLRGPYGRYGVFKVNFHLYPLRSYALSLPTPQPVGAGRVTLDPAGREVPLFQRGQTSDRAPDEIRETDLPDEILCRRFNASRHALTPEALGEINSPALDAALEPLVGVTFRSAASFREIVATRLTPAQAGTFMGPLLDATLVEGSPKHVLWPGSLALATGPNSGAAPLPPSAVVAADLGAWGAGTTLQDHVALAVDPGTGRVVDGPARNNEDLFVPLLHYGQFAPVGAGGYGRSAQLAGVVPDSEFDADPNDPGPVTGFALPAPLTGSHRFTSSATYEPTLPPGRVFGGITEARLDAADTVRPYVRFRPDAATLDITFEAAAPVPGETRTLTIDGLWLGLLAETLAAENTGAGVPATPVRARIVLAGGFDRVTLNSVTLDPGGEMARDDPAQAVAIPYVTLEIAGQVDLLEINRSVTGPIQEALADPDRCNAGEIRICDSIVQSIVPTEPAIRTHLGHLHLVRTTVLGRVAVARLYASDSLVDGRIRVTDNQHGCFRYSATGDHVGLPGGAAVLPQQFEALVVPGTLPVHWLAAQRFGDPWFAALSRTAPESLSRGGSNGSEMGAFNARGLQVMLDDLSAQVIRYLPVGLVPQYLIDFEQETPP